jgi:hypothetical protein
VLLAAVDVVASHAAWHSGSVFSSETHRWLFLLGWRNSGSRHDQLLSQALIFATTIMIAD